jgi:hypothetical protein
VTIDIACPLLSLLGSDTKSWSNLWRSCVREWLCVVQCMEIVLEGLSTPETEGKWGTESIEQCS